MARKRHTAEEIVAKLRQVDVLMAQVEQVLKDRPDVILFTPVDDKAMIQPVKKLNAANIPVHAMLKSGRSLLLSHGGYIPKLPT